MKVARYLVLFALSVGLASASLRYREEQDLRLRNANLCQTLSDIQRLRQANQRLAKLSIDPEELKRLGREKSELMRLRAEVGELMRTAGPKLQQERPTLSRPVAQPRNNPPRSRTRSTASSGPCARSPTPMRNRPLRTAQRFPLPSSGLSRCWPNYRKTSARSRHAG